MELSKRLRTVACAVTPGNRVADIGTDHAYVPIYLLEKKISPSAIAMDVNRGPLERARDHIEEKHLTEKISVRLSDGLNKITPDETDTVVIAGMGGALTCRILENNPEFAEAGIEFVLQPQSEWSKVRRYLEEIHYVITAEWFLEDEGKFYTVIKALPKESTNSQYVYENKEGLSEEMLYEFGSYNLREKNPDFMEYIKRQLEKREVIRDNIRQITEKNKQTSNRLLELENEIKELKRIMED